MALPFTSDPTVVASRWRTLTDDESTLAEVLLEDAEIRLLARIPDITSRYADETLSAALVQQVQVAMVLRVLRNPDGLVSETIGDYSYRRSDEGAAAIGLYVTADELALLRASTRRALWTQPTTRDNYSTTDGEWVPVEGSDNPFPWYSAEDELL